DEMRDAREKEPPTHVRPPTAVRVEHDRKTRGPGRSRVRCKRLGKRRPTPQMDAVARPEMRGIGPGERPPRMLSAGPRVRVVSLWVHVEIAPRRRKQRTAVDGSGPRAAGESTPEKRDDRRRRHQRCAKPPRPHLPTTPPPNRATLP